MSFSIGSGTTGMGPRSALEDFGSVGENKGGEMVNWQVVRRMLQYLRPYALRMVAAFLLTLVGSGLTLLIPYLMKVAIDQYITPGNAAGLAGIAGALAAAFVGSFAVSAGQQYLLAWVGQRVLVQLRAELFDRLQRMHLGYHDTHIVGVTVSRVINDVAEINELLSQGVITLLGDLVVLVGIIVVMLGMSPKLALLTFAVLPLMVGATWMFSRQAQRAFRETRSKVAAVVGDLAEDLNGMRAIQAFSQEQAARARFERVNKANRNAYVNAMTLSFIFLPTIEILGMLATVIVLGFGGYWVITGSVTLGIMVAFLSYVTRFFQPIQELSRLYTTFQSAMAGGEAALKLLDTPLGVMDAPNAPDLAVVRGDVELEHVDFRYRSETPLVLHDICMRIPAGSMAALVGPTGAGKTSVASLVMRFYDPSAGRILVDGVDIRSVTQSSLRQQVRIVTQDPFLFSRSITENIRFGKPGATQAEVEQAARQANAHAFISALPDGYDTRIAEGGINLSVGQRQLISIARAFLTDPRILLLDEATASIDTITELLIQQALEGLLQNRTAIVIAHRLSTILRADWIYVIDDGCVVEQGKHASLLEQDGLYASLYRIQFRKPE